MSADRIVATVADLLENYVIDEHEFDIPLPGGKVIRFRTYKRKSEYDELVSGGVQWIKSLPEAGSDEGKAHPLFGHVWPETHEEMMTAYMLHYFSVDPKLGLADAMALLKAPLLIDVIMGQVDRYSKSLSTIQWSQSIEEAKKKQTTSQEGDGSSPQPRKSTRNSPKT